MRRTTRCAPPQGIWLDPVLEIERMEGDDLAYSGKLTQMRNLWEVRGVTGVGT